METSHTRYGYDSIVFAGGEPEHGEQQPPQPGRLSTPGTAPAERDKHLPRGYFFVVLCSPNTQRWYNICNNTDTYTHRYMHRYELRYRHYHTHTQPQGAHTGACTCN